MESLPEGTQTVGQLTTRIQLALRDVSASGLWLVGEISGKRVDRHGRVYFDLLDRPEPDSPHRAKIAVSCAPSQAKVVGRKTRAASVSLNDGVQVRLFGRLAVWAQGGSYKLDMSDVDAAWTLASQQATREMLLEKLKLEGVLDKNSALPLPGLPMHVALITSPGSHAAADFEQQLAASGMGFQVKLFPSLVQGPDAPSQIHRALEAIKAHHVSARWRPSVVVCVRGGGARSDLAAWDDPVVVRAIADCPYPVVVAVGHELDQSIADVAAALSVKTPTAAAQWLIDRVGTVLGSVESAMARADKAVSRRLDSVGLALNGLAARSKRRVPVLLAETSATVDRLAASASPAASRNMLSRTVEVSSLRSDALKGAQGRLLVAETGLSLARAHVSAADPQRILRRGFAVVRDESGAVVKQAATLASGDRLSVQLADGVKSATVV